MMRKITISIIAILLLAIPAMAVSPEGEQYINKIVGGNNTSLRKAAQDIYNAKLTERVVLDVLAEKVLLSLSYNNTDSLTRDAVAWACKALGRSGDIRYKNVLNIVKDQTKHSKIKKYAELSLKMMSDGKVKAPYKKGSMDLVAMQKRLEKGRPALPPKKKSKPKKKKPKPKKVEEKKSVVKPSLSIIRKGMTLQEVKLIIGSPTSIKSHVNKKTFNPFYYGNDYAQLTHFYKGQGRVSYSQRSSYSNAWRVIDVQINPEETGYP